MILKITSVLVVSFLLISCAHKEYHGQQGLDVTVVEGLKGHRWSNIYFSRQPSEAQLKKLKAAGFQTIINLRAREESKYLADKEEEIFKIQKINYYNVPLTLKKDITDEYIAEVTDIVKQHRNEGNILIHCKGGSRVALWLGAHFKKDHKFSNSESFRLAVQMGLRDPVAQMKLKKYLEK